MKKIFSIYKRDMLRAAGYKAFRRAVVLDESEPPQAASRPAAPTAPAPFRKERRLNAWGS